MQIWNHPVCKQGLYPVGTSTDAGELHKKLRRKWGGLTEAPFEALWANLCKPTLKPLALKPDKHCIRIHIAVLLHNLCEVIPRYILGCTRITFLTISKIWLYKHHALKAQCHQHSLPQNPTKLQNSLVQNVLGTTFGFVGKVVSEKSSTVSLQFPLPTLNNKPSPGDRSDCRSDLCVHSINCHFDSWYCLWSP